ncbi:TonB-dependent receptor domain-containing protein [Oleiharenicola lentus]|uniref:TonB-dependent receptor domain-containing protein n=1 Tax=Oleiharenicola lentus TaxID=2508720 RepID=UPI003F66385A
MNTPHNPVRQAGARAIAFTVLSLLAANAALAQTNAPTSAPAEQTVSLEKFEVTGSRIKRIDSEGPQPIVQITREELDLSGYTSVGDAIRNLPFNTGGSIDPQRTSTFASSARTLNLRGLGSQNTLVLINGRRAAPFGLPGNNGFNAVFDLNSLPPAAINSLEVLKDGASAIYGSDAVSGVINIKLRENYSGFTTTTTLGNTTDSDSFYKQFTVVTGASTAKTSLVFAADYAHRNALKLSDRDFSATADLRYYGGVNARSSLTYPGRVTVPGLGTVTYSAPTATPTAAAAVTYNAALHAYNFNEVTDLMPLNETYGFYVRGKHELTDKVYAFTELSWHRNDGLSIAAAAPISGGSEQGTSPAGQLIFPATNPFNPFGVDISGNNLVFRLVELGGRTTHNVSDTPRMLVGLGGTLFSDWTWEASAMTSHSDVSTTNTNQALDRQVQAALSGVRGPQSGRTLYLNPFGPNDPELINFLRANFNRSDRQRMRLYDATAGGSVFALPAGDVGVAVGIESRDEKLSQFRSADEQAGQIIGGSEGQNTQGDRKVQSAYAEVRVPIVKGTEIQVAGRFENYSDFGETAKPKIGVSTKVLPWLLLRGSFSKAFKAPDLPQLFNGGTVSFSSGSVVDPRRPADAPRQLRIVTIGNSTLTPETTDVYYGGFLFEPQKNGALGFLHGFTFAVDYFQFEGTNVIANFGAGVILNNELASPIFGNRVIRAAQTPADIAAGLPGSLLFVNDSFQNTARQSYRGWDFSARYEWKTASFGRFFASATMTYLNELSFDTFESVGTFATPRVRGNLSLSWKKDALSASVFANYIGAYDDIGVASTALGGNGLLNEIEDLWLFNPQVTYRLSERYAFTLGANNVLDTDPPRAYTSTTSTGYDNLTHSGEGRFVFVKVTLDF